MNEKIAVIEDEVDLRKNLVNLLQTEKYQVVAFSTGHEGLNMIPSLRPDLVLLDLRLPDMDGLEICRALKKNVGTASIPIIMVTSKSDEIDLVIGLEMGAEDYILKPYRNRELLARVRTALRRRFTGTNQEFVIERGPIRANGVNYTATANGESLELTPKEFRLLMCFLQRENQVVTRSTISYEVWGVDLSNSSRTIDVHVEHLRRKLEPYDVEIAGLKGVGYRFIINKR